MLGTREVGSSRLSACRAARCSAWCWADRDLTKAALPVQPPPGARTTHSGQRAQTALRLIQGCPGDQELTCNPTKEERGCARGT